MTSIKRLAFVLLLLAALPACDMQDMREDPNAPTNVPENLLLAGLQANFSYEMLGGDPARVPSHWIQQLAFTGVPPSMDNYNFTESDSDNLWAYNGYTDVMQNARIMIQKADASGNKAYAGIGRTILAWSLGIMTDLYGDIPYSEAFRDDIRQPKYDTQEQIYAEIFKLLDQAVADLAAEPGALRPGADDMVYGGSTAAWARLAHTLKARYLMHLTSAPGHNAQTQAQQALAELALGLRSNDDAPSYQYFDSPKAENPWFQWVIDGKWDTRDQLSKHYVDLLKGRNDPRLPVQARPVGAVDNNGLTGAEITDPQYVGHQNGDEGSGAKNYSSVGAYYSDPGQPLNWMTYAEALFLKAEATFILNGAAAADPIYRDAIRASMEQLGVNEADAEDYVSARPTLGANALEEIMTEKYIALFLDPEAYNDWRRTDYPRLQMVTNDPQSPRIPLRFPYPSSELSNNPANVPSNVGKGKAALPTPVWWDTVQ